MSGVRLHDRGMEQLLNSPEVARALERVGDKVVKHAKAHARVDTGDWQKSIQSKVTRDDGDRVTVRVYSDDPGALAIEARDRTLAQALLAAKDG